MKKCKEFCLLLIILFDLFPAFSFGNSYYCSISITNLRPMTQPFTTDKGEAVGMVGNLLIPLCKSWYKLVDDDYVKINCMNNLEDRLFISPIDNPKDTCTSILTFPISVKFADGKVCVAKKKLTSITEHLRLYYPRDFTCKKSSSSNDTKKEKIKRQSKKI